MEKESDYIGAIRFGASGSVHYFRNWVIPLGDEIVATIEVNTQNEPPESSLDIFHSVKPRAIHIEQSIYIQIILYMTTELGSWVMGKVYDAISSKIMKAVKSKLTDTHFEGNCRVTVIYTNNVSVTVDGPIQSDKDIETFKKSIPEAQQTTFTWQQSNKTTNKVLVYKIKDGSLSQEMIL